MSIGYLPTLAEFRALRDAFARAEYEAALPGLQAAAADAYDQRVQLKHQMSRYEKRRQRIPADLESEYLAACWRWQNAVARYTATARALDALNAKEATDKAA